MVGIVQADWAIYSTVPVGSWAVSLVPRWSRRRLSAPSPGQDLPGKLTCGCQPSHTTENAQVSSSNQAKNHVNITAPGQLLRRHKFLIKEPGKKTQGRLLVIKP